MDVTRNHVSKRIFHNIKRENVNFVSYFYFWKVSTQNFENDAHKLSTETYRKKVQASIPATLHDLKKGVLNPRSNQMC
jgi:arabinogalactan endo-1,4-beta-galactosidase